MTYILILLSQAHISVYLGGKYFPFRVYGADTYTSIFIYVCSN